MEQPKIVLAFVSKLCAGKGTAIAYLADKYGFTASSCSDRIREEIKKNGEEITRDGLQETGGRLRKEFGPQVLAERTWNKFLEEGVEKAVVDSIRGIEEVEFFKSKPNFHLIALESTSENRFARMVARKRESDPQTWEDFLAAEEKDNKGGGRDIDACMEMADFRIENNGTTEEMYKQIDHLLQKIDL